MATTDPGPCPGCGERSWREIQPDDRSFILLECAACGTEAQITERPDQRSLYEEYYATESADRVAGPLAAIWAGFRRRKAVRILGVLPDGPRILDVGCERGELLHELRALGAEVAGTQISGQAAQFARRRFGIDVFVGELTDAAYPAGSFDAVLMVNVLEHLPDPEAYVAEIARILRPSGIFWIELPNPRSPTSRLSRKRWLHADPRHHYWAFTERGLRHLLGRHRIDLEAVGHWSWEHGPIGCVQSWLNFLPGPRNVLFDLVVGGVDRRRLALQALHVMISGLLLLPAVVFSAAESASRAGQVMRLIGRKRADAGQ